MITLDSTEAVEVFDLDDRRRDLARGRFQPDVHVGVDVQATFLHVAIGDVQKFQQQLEFREIRLGFLGRTHVGLGDDFQQGRAGAVEIDPRIGFARASSCRLLPASSSK